MLKGCIKDYFIQFTLHYKLNLFGQIDVLKDTY